MSTRAFSRTESTITPSGLRRAIRHLVAGPLHVGDWLVALVTVTVLATTFALLLQVLDIHQARTIAWLSLTLGSILLVGGAELRAREAAWFGRAPGPRDVLLVVGNGVTLLVCASVVLVPSYL
jgi:hypothetical protein